MHFVVGAGARDIGAAGGGGLAGRGCFAGNDMLEVIMNEYQ